MSEIELKSNVIKTGREKGIILRFILASLVGVFMFFVPVTINGASSIMIDHIVSWIRASVPGIVPYYALFVMAIGAIYPFYTKKWNASIVDICFSILKVVGVVFGILYCLKVGPAWFFAPDIGPFLYEKLVISVSLLVPIGSAFLALLVGYGLLEFIGTFCRPIMRPLWNTPGDRRSMQLRPSLEVIRLPFLLRTACIKKESIRQKKRRLSLQDFLQYPLHL